MTLADHREIAASAKCAACAGQHHNTDVFIRRDGTQRRVQRDGQIFVQGVQAIGAIESEKGDTLFPLLENQRSCGRRVRWRAHARSGSLESSRSASSSCSKFAG